jgi:hypothetical protein
MKEKMLLMLPLPNWHKENLIFFVKKLGLHRASIGAVTSVTSDKERQVFL